MEPALNAVVDLLTAAARAGHTVLPPDVVLRTCSAADAEAAVASGVVLDVEWCGAPAWALAEVAESEELLADGLLGLAEENRLAVVVGAESDARAAALNRALGDRVASVVLDDAHLVGLDDVLAAVEDLPEGAVLALSLDNALPLGEVTGAVALDLAAAQICPVLVADRGRDTTALSSARREVAAGRWFEPVPEDRSFVAVQAASPDEAVVRVTQLVSTSIPRAFGHAGSAIAVLVADESVDPDALRTALVAAGGELPELLPLRAGLAGSWPAVVVVLPGPGSRSLTRALVYAGLRAGTEHVSIVHGFPPDATLATALAQVTDRPRRTRLRELLTS